MSQCCVTTAKGTLCSIAAKHTIEGKLYCTLHKNQLDRKNGVAPAPKKDVKPKPEPKKDQNLYKSSESADFSDENYKWLKPENLENLKFNGMTFMNAEHAYHFMRFFYKKGVKIDPEPTAVAIMGARTIEKVRDIVRKESSKEWPVWKSKIHPDSSFTVGDTIMMDILNAAFSDKRLASKLASITLPFSDDENEVMVTTDYAAVLDVVRRKLRM